MWRYSIVNRVYTWKLQDKYVNVWECLPLKEVESHFLKTIDKNTLNLWDFMLNMVILEAKKRWRVKVILHRAWWV